MQVPGGQLAHLPRADQQHRLAVEPVEDLPRQLDRGEGDETARRPTSVSVRTRLATPKAWLISAWSTGPTVPADWASAKASFTWPRICGSPRTMESRLAATRKACSTASSPVFV